MSELVRGSSCFIPSSLYCFCGLKDVAGHFLTLPACQSLGLYPGSLHPQELLPASRLSPSGCRAVLLAGGATVNQAGWVCVYEHRRPPGGRQGELVHQKWRFIGARATNSMFFCRGKAAFLLKLEVLEALARHGVCMWGQKLSQTP